jgi:hypothetical protein
VTLKERIGAFDHLGRILKRYLEDFLSYGKSIARDFTSPADSLFSALFETIEKTLEEACLINPWFTRDNINISLSEIARILNQENLNLWLNQWKEENLSPRNPMRIGVIMAGNIPLVGFHDFLSVLITGNKFIGKLSSRDDRLIPMIGDLLTGINSGFRDMIEFTDEKLSGIDAIIATGSNNTYRYFDYYFGKYPHIFRKNRNSAAIIQGNETPDQLGSLGEDIFTYFGLGCRNISKVFVPEKYKLRILFEALEKFSYVTEHNKYMNNYMYYKSVYLLNRIPHYDNGFIILKQDNSYHSPIGVLFYDYYSSIEKLIDKLVSDVDLLQCITGHEIQGLKTIPFGKTQSPELWDYADDVNTIKFLVNLVKKTGHDL